MNFEERVYNLVDLLLGIHRIRPELTFDDCLKLVVGFVDDLEKKTSKK